MSVHVLIQKGDGGQGNNKSLSTQGQRKSWSWDHCKQSPWDPDWMGKSSDLSCRESQSRTYIRKGKKFGLERNNHTIIRVSELVLIIEGEWKQGVPGNDCIVQQTRADCVTTAPLAMESWAQSFAFQWLSPLVFLMPLLAWLPTPPFTFLNLSTWLILLIQSQPKVYFLPETCLLSAPCTSHFSCICNAFFGSSTGI